MKKSPEKLEKEVDRLRFWLETIHNVAWDRDGFASAEDLGKLVDELYGYAKDALNGEVSPLQEIAES